MTGETGRERTWLEAIVAGHAVLLGIIIHRSGLLDAGIQALKRLVGFDKASAADPAGMRAVSPESANGRQSESAGNETAVEVPKVPGPATSPRSL